MLRQYAHFKKKFPDTVLLFRVGGFYESYLGDAQILHDTLGLTLTTRTGADQPMKLAGVPAEYVDRYLKRLLAAGYRVALCELIQSTDVPAGERVVRAVTEDHLMEPGRLVKKEVRP
jgi:DNA mismatch repair protein MutS